MSKQFQILYLDKIYYYLGILDSKDYKIRDNYFKINSQGKAKGRYIDKILRANIFSKICYQSQNDLVGQRACVKIQTFKSKKWIIAKYSLRLSKRIRHIINGDG